MRALHVRRSGWSAKVPGGRCSALRAVDAVGKTDTDDAQSQEAALSAQQSRRRERRRGRRYGNATTERRWRHSGWWGWRSQRGRGGHDGSVHPPRHSHHRIRPRQCVAYRVLFATLGAISGPRTVIRGVVEHGDEKRPGERGLGRRHRSLSCLRLLGRAHRGHPRTHGRPLSIFAHTSSTLVYLIIFSGLFSRRYKLNILCFDNFIVDKKKILQ